MDNTSDNIKQINIKNNVFQKLQTLSSITPNHEEHDDTQNEEQTKISQSPPSVQKKQEKNRDCQQEEGDK